MFSNGLFVFLISISISNISFAQSAATSSVSENSDSTDVFYLCKRERTIRWLRAYKLENGKCKALYSKEGYLQVISSATYFASCEGVLLSVKKNLEEGNFKCSQISKVSVIELETE